MQKAVRSKQLEKNTGDSLRLLPSAFRLLPRASRGFSLIELTVVMAIIAILATVVIASVSKSRTGARDARRYADLSQIQISLEAYYNLNGSYPSTGGTYHSVCTGGYLTTGATGYIPNLAPAFIPVLPTDPRGCPSAGTVHGYAYKSDGVNYKIATDGSAEIGSECTTGKAFYDSRGAGYCARYTPAAAAW